VAPPSGSPGSTNGKKPKNKVPDQVTPPEAVPEAPSIEAEDASAAPPSASSLPPEGLEGGAAAEVAEAPEAAADAPPDAPPDGPPDAPPEAEAPPLYNDASPYFGVDVRIGNVFGPPTSTLCGPNTCNVNEVCCNPSCGICALPGESCSQQLCTGIENPVSVYCGMNTCNVGEICCNPTCGICVRPGETCRQEPCPP
jgi:hypothetical protein